MSIYIPENLWELFFLIPIYCSLLLFYTQIYFFFLFRDFRSSFRLRGLQEYYFTSFESALKFIQEVDLSKLKIDKEEF